MPNVIQLLNGMDNSPLSNYQQSIKARADSGQAPWLGDGLPSTGYRFTEQNREAADNDWDALQSGLLSKYGADWFPMSRKLNRDTSLMSDEVRRRYEDSLQARAIFEAAKAPAKAGRPLPLAQYVQEPQQQWAAPQPQQGYAAFQRPFNSPFSQQFQPQQQPQRSAEEAFYRATQAGVGSRPDSKSSYPMPATTPLPTSAAPVASAPAAFQTQNTGFRLPNSNAYNLGFAKPQQTTVNTSAYRRGLRYDR